MNAFSDSAFGKEGAFGRSAFGVPSEGDPLAGIPFRMRWETHWGDKVLRPDFFQDASRTVPAGVFDQVATMGADDLELVPTESDIGRQGMLLSAADDTPYLALDGIDDRYIVGSFGGSVVLSALLRSQTAVFNSFWGAVNSVPDGIPSSDRLAVFSSGFTKFHSDPFPASVRLNGVDLVSPFDLGDIQQWMVLTMVTNTVASAQQALFQLENSHHGACDAIAMCIYDGSPSDAHRDAVEACYNTLKPAA